MFYVFEHKNMFKFPIHSSLKKKKKQEFPPLKVKNCPYRKGPKLTSWSTLNFILHSLRNVFFVMVVLSKHLSCGRQSPEVLYAHLLPKSYYLAIPEKCYPLNSSCTFIALPLCPPSLYPFLIWTTAKGIFETMLHLAN